jgi:4'-phosphopantetheinyl transferase
MVAMPGLYAVNLTESIPIQQFSQLSAMVTLERQRRIKALRRYKDAIRALIAELLLGEVIFQHTGLKLTEVELAKNNYGKPFLRSNQDIKFNISHSGDWVVCVINAYEVGVDVEKIKPIEQSLWERFFAPEECAALLATPTVERIAHFFELWTLKESYVKAVGQGLSLSLSSFAIQVTPAGIIICQDGKISTDWHFRQYELAPGYKLAVCSAQQQLPERVEVVNVAEFITVIS